MVEREGKSGEEEPSGPSALRGAARRVRRSGWFSLWHRANTNGGIFLGVYRPGRFVVVLSLITGLKRGRLSWRGLHDYWRWKPFYLAWGWKTRTVALLRPFNRKFVRLDAAPFRIEIIATPRDIWAHWKSLKERPKTERSEVPEPKAKGPNPNPPLEIP